jgi:hypothetical protein
MRSGAYDDRKADFYEAFGLGMFHVTHPEVQLFVSLSVIVCTMYVDDKDLDRYLEKLGMIEKLGWKRMP